MVDMKEKGERLKNLLKDSGLTQVALAEMVDTSDKYISQVVTGRKQLGMKTAQKIAKVLNVKYEYLLGEINFPTDKEANSYHQEIFEEQRLTTQTLLASSLRVLPMEPLDGKPWGSRQPETVIIKDTRYDEDDSPDTLDKDFVCSYEDFSTFNAELDATIRDIIRGKVNRFLKKCRRANEIESACMEHYDRPSMSLFTEQFEARSDPRALNLAYLRFLGEEFNKIKEELDKTAPPE